MSQWGLQGVVLRGLKEITCLANSRGGGGNLTGRETIDPGCVFTVLVTFTNCVFYRSEPVHFIYIISEHFHLTNLPLVQKLHTTCRPTCIYTAQIAHIIDMDMIGGKIY